MTARNIVTGWVIGCVLAAPMGLRASRAQETSSASVESRAIAYLSREVPKWRRAHPCYSCHNNGDAARALVAALGHWAGSPTSGRHSLRR